MHDVDVVCPNPEASGDDMYIWHISLSKNIKDTMHIARGIELFVACFCRAFFVYIHNTKKNNIHTTAKKREKRKEREAKRLREGTINSWGCAIIVLSLRHLATQALLEPATATATSGSATPPAWPPSSLLYLFSLVTLAALTTVSPASRPAELVVQGLLVLLHQCVDLICQHLRQLLRPRQFDSMERNYSSRLI